MDDITYKVQINYLSVADHESVFFCARMLLPSRFASHLPSPGPRKFRSVAKVFVGWGRGGRLGAFQAPSGRELPSVCEAEGVHVPNDLIKWTISRTDIESIVLPYLKVPHP